MEKFLAGNEWQWRLARTIAQGVLGVFVANIDLILGYAILDPTLRALVVAFAMAGSRRSWRRSEAMRRS